MPKTLNERMKNDFNLLIKLENDMQPVRDLIRERKFCEANRLCSDLLNKQYGSFVARFRKLIAPMAYLDPDEYMEWLTQKKKYYLYDMSIPSENNNPQKLPAVIASERIVLQDYEPTKKEENSI